jgi:hypothetical protein
MFVLITLILPNLIDTCLNFYRRKIHAPFEQESIYFTIFKIIFGKQN